MNAPVAKNIQTQVDFSAGELDIEVKRGEEDIDKKIAALIRSGLRQGANWRILNSKKITNRPGRSALFLGQPRVEEVRMSPTALYRLCFTNETISIRDSTDTQIFIQHTFPWSFTTLTQIVWSVYDKFIYVTFPGMRPQVLSWDGVSTWSIAAYDEDVTAGGQKRTAFYRISPKGITLSPSGNTGNITLTFSANVLVGASIGTRIRYAGRQILITGVTNGTTGTGTVEESLFGAQRLTFGSAPSSQFSVGDEVIGSVSGAKGFVTGFSGGGNTMDVVLLGIIPFRFAVVASPTDTVVGPHGSIVLVSAASIADVASVNWDEEVMSGWHGWPASTFVDQNRLGFCDFPSIPEGIAWSAFAVPTDLYPAADSPDNAMFELVPKKSRVLFVVAGAESSEFVFADNGIWYIPINPQNPLKPGSVAFQLLSGDGSAKVQPKVVQEVILYVNAGGNSLCSVIAPGAYYRPFETRNLSENAAHLFKNIVAIAVPTADGSFNERYAYVLNGDGSLTTGKYTAANGIIQGSVGWLPWIGVGTVKWVSALAANVLFSTSYAPNAITPVVVTEALDVAQYLDGAIFVNNVPAGIPTPGGKGPLWWLAGGTVDLMDLGTRMMGTYQIDANGFIIPQNNAGEDLTSPTLVAGQPWTAIAEPFVIGASPGQDLQQRTRKRRIARGIVYVKSSSGFLIAKRIFSGPVTPSSPAVGTVMSQQRISTWNQDDDPTLAPPLRETAYTYRPMGHAYDPRTGFIKDTPGPLTIEEITLEIGV